METESPINEEALRQFNLAEGDSTERIDRSEHEQKAILDRAIFITKVLGRRSDLVALPGESWAAGLSQEVQNMLNRGVALEEIDPSLLEPKVLIYPQQDLIDRGDDYILGVNRHEIGHFLYSDYRKLLEFQKKAKSEGKNPEDAQTLVNAIEDPRVNNLLAGESFRARERLEHIYHQDTPKVLERFPLMSSPMQFCFLALGSWISEFAEEGTVNEMLDRVTDQEVITAFNEALPRIKQAMAERRGVKASEIISEEIWPIYRRLVDDYLENPQKGEGGAQGKVGEQSKLWEELSEEEKERARVAAREQLDRENKEFNEEFGPRTLEGIKDENGITHYEPKEVPSGEAEAFKERLAERNKELAERAARERSEQNRRNLELRGQSAGLAERRTGLTEGEQAKYQEYSREMRAGTDKLKKDLNEIFPPREEYFWEKSRSRGSRITSRKLPREAMTGRGLFFEKKEVREKPQAICSILMDVSGSMHWTGAIDLAVKEMIMFIEALDSNEIDFEIIVFSDSPELIKKFNERVSGATRKQIIGLLESGGGGTAIGKSIEFGAKRLEAKMKHDRLPGFLVVQTDGQPGDDMESVLNAYRSKVPIFGIGVGSDINEQSIKKYFGDNGCYTADPTEAPRAIIDLLKRGFARFRPRY